MSSALPDAEERLRIEEDLDHSLVVVAGAGTGKTSSLVGRVVELVRRGTPLRELAVITFTEAAAAELRARLTEALDKAAAAEPDVTNLSGALIEVDEAAVCTLHAFSQRILVEHALAAGLPPGFDVLDELSDRAELEERLARFTDALLDDPDAETMLLRGFVFGLGQSAMSAIAWCLHSHWDRLEDGGLEDIEAGRPTGPWPEVDISPVLSALESVIATAQFCTDQDDLLFGHLTDTLEQSLEVLRRASSDEQAVLPLLLRLPKFSCANGRKENWGGRHLAVREACAEAEAARQAVLDEVRAPVMAELLARLARFTLDAADARAAEGRLSFHDLLVHARQVLRHDDGARATLRRRYRYLLVDEFQDTDPLQVELAAWLASSVEGTGEIAEARPGALFVVGDPKQSIYRFRRADIALFERVSQAVGDEMVLTANFRSVPGVVRFVNAVFPSLFGTEPPPGQARYHPLVPQRPSLPARPGTSAVQLSLTGIGPEEPDPAEAAPAPVVVLGGPLDGSVGEVRRAAAQDVALAVRRVTSEGWPVSDPDRPGASALPARWRDIAVLFPTRSSLPAIEEAFDEAAISYRLEGAALLWGSGEVRDVLDALAAADEPSDAVSVLAALRSPGLACGDDDLVDWHQRGGSWDPRAEIPAGAEHHPVARAMGVLGELHRRRWWGDPSELVAQAMELLHSHALAFAHHRPRQGWQRLSWLGDQARLFDDTVGGSLHDFLGWAELQCQGDGRSASLGPPESDDDAVRVMTVHGAKGLEFPVVVVVGLERDDNAGQRTDAVLWADDGAVETGAGLQLRSAGYEDAALADRELDRLERVRLLYVAMTRPRDHLVLAVHHRIRSSGPDGSYAAMLEELCRAHPLLWRRLPELDVDPGGRPVASNMGAVRAGAANGNGTVATGKGGDDAVAVRRWAAELGEFTEQRTETLERLRALPVVTANALATHTSAGVDSPTGAEDEGWAPQGGSPRSGNTGLDIGRAVHGTLGALDLASAVEDVPGSTAPARQRALVHGVEEHAEDVIAMVHAALASPLLHWSATKRHHQEAYLAMPLGEGAGLFEGFADLVVEDDDGLVVVDYKTDHVSDAASLRELTARYAPQVAAYALALGAATGRPVVRAVLLFLAPDGVQECVLQGEELAEAKAASSVEMRRLAGLPFGDQVTSL